MNVSRILALLAGLLIPAAVAAQGYAGLGTGGAGFRQPDPAHILDFPADHGAHPGFRIEWWYLTANLTDAEGHDYGIQWTLFRLQLAPGPMQEGWARPEIWMGHAALTTADAHYFAEKLARGGIGQAGVRADPFKAWIDDWQMAGPEFGQLGLTATDPTFAYDLSLKASGPLVPHGQAGYSVKSAGGQASHYYSQPNYAVTGSVTVEGRKTAVTGQAWLDREWSSEPLQHDQPGWDWFSLRFPDGAELMGFRLRGDGGDYTSATWIAPDGTPTSYPDGAFTARVLTRSDVEGYDIPTRWHVLLPGMGIDLIVEAINPNALNRGMFTYWEGPVRANGSHDGLGYLEMTGYE